MLCHRILTWRLNPRGLSGAAISDPELSTSDPELSTYVGDILWLPLCRLM